MAEARAADRLRVAGVLVVYDAARPVRTLLPPLQSCLEHLILVDNSPEGHPDLADVAESPGLTVLRNRNRGLLAGAYNRALDWLRAHPVADHVLFLDEDSEVEPVAVFLAAGTVRLALARSEVSAVAPLYVERETGLPGAHIRLARWTFRVLPREPEGPVEVSFLINSMSLWKWSALDHIGPYNEGLGLDHIDTDYCLRAGRLGYRLILDPCVRFSHSIGRRRPYTLFGKRLQSGGHGPARRRAIGRNTVLLAKHFGGRHPAFLFLCLARLGYELLGIAVAETGRAAKLGGLLGGALGGLFARYRCP